MPRNLSESQLVQIGSKAISNVAGQFSKLGQSLNPAKIRAAKAPTTGPKSNTLPQSSSSTSLETGIIADEESMANFTIGSGHLTKPTIGSGDEYDSDDASVEIRAATEATTASHSNAFLPSVGIVMASNEVAASAHQLVTDNQQHQEQHTMAAIGNATKRFSADVCTMSLSSVMDNINMPAGMLECSSPTMRSRSPAPEIRVDDVPEGSSSGLGKSGAQTFSRSSGEMRSDASGALDGAQYVACNFVYYFIQ